MRRAVFAALAALALAAPSPAQQPPTQQQPAGAAVSGAAKETPPAAPKAAEAPLNLQMKEVEIRGEVERPEVFYIIPRREARMELGPLTKDFSQEIMEPLLPGPFEERVRQSQRKNP